MPFSPRLKASCRSANTHEPMTKTLLIIDRMRTRVCSPEEFQAGLARATHGRRTSCSGKTTVGGDQYLADWERTHSKFPPRKKETHTSSDSAKHSSWHV